MEYAVFSDTQNEQFKYCFLVTKIQEKQILEHYINVVNMGHEDVAAGILYKKPSGKTPVKIMRAYIEEELLPFLGEIQPEYLIVGDADYFKLLTGTTKVDANLGYVLKSTFGPWYVAYVPNYLSVFYNPIEVKKKILLGLENVISHSLGHYERPGSDIIKFSAFPQVPEEIEEWLEDLILADRPLTCDIEGFSLKHYSAGIGTISFAWDKHSGISFPVDLGSDPERVRAALKSFFKRFKNKLIFHYISYDVTVLIYQLFMKDLFDNEGLLEGLQVMLKDWDDTKLISYLATNSCAGNKLSLKDQAQEYAGNYSMGDDIKDITKVPLDQLLEYNLVDCLSTWFVHEKHWDTMVNDDQEEIYEDIFKPAIVDIIQMQLTGMPVDYKRALEVNEYLKDLMALTEQNIANSPIIKEFTLDLEYAHVAKRNSELKTKRIKIGDEPQVFNPNSDTQLRKLLFEKLDLPVINLTKSKQASTDGETIEALLNHVDDQTLTELLKEFQIHAIISILLTTFMPAILNAQEITLEDGTKWHMLFGNFNLAGTLSGRLSCVAPWTKIKTQRGLIPITDIKIGDMVWTHKRRWKPVTNVIQKPNEDMFDIHFCNGYVLSCTSKHQLNIPNIGWKTLQEIINEHIKNVDSEPYKYRSSHSKLSKFNDYCIRFGQETKHNGPKYISCIKAESFKNRIKSLKSSSILSFKSRRKEPNERQIRNQTSQLYRNGFGWVWLSNHFKKWKKKIRSSCCLGRDSWYRRFTRSLRSAPYRWGSNEQRIGQPNFMHKERSSENPFFNGDDCYGKIQKINYRGFIPVWDITVQDDESYWAEGCFNHNSSDPNLQNIPSTGKGHALKLKFAKMIKSIFAAPYGWLFVGIDFSSLEDRISALTTKDPNKLKVYTDGYDGHSLRAISYFGEQMTDVKMAPEESECYSAQIGSQTIYFYDEEEIEYLGTKMKGKELYALLANKGL